MRRFIALALPLVVSSLWLACSSDGGGGSTPDGGGPSESGVPDVTAPTDTGTDAGQDATDSGEDGGDGGGPHIGPGPYTIAYSGSNGIGLDQRRGVTATFGALGELDGYSAGGTEAPTRATNQEGELYVDELSLMGRWNGGVTAGTLPGGPQTYSATQGFHHAMVIQPAAVPTTGTITYAFAKATSATIDDGTLAVGTITAKAAILFGATMKTGLELTITMPGDVTYTATTTGGVADPSQSAMSSFNNVVNGDLTVSGAGGAACAGSSACSVSVRGVVGGGTSGGARLGVVFVLGSGTNAKSIRGAAVFKAP